MCKHHSTAGNLHNLSIISNSTSQSEIAWVLQRALSAWKMERASVLLWKALPWCGALGFAFVRFHIPMVTNVLGLFKYYFYIKKFSAWKFPAYALVQFNGCEWLFADLFFPLNQCNYDTILWFPLESEKFNLEPYWRLPHTPKIPGSGKVT